MSQIKRITYAVCALCVAVCCSCQQQAVSAPRGASVGVRNYSDAVVHINQVDPAYRAYFREQDASNYSLSDQRKAYIAATEVARTPVRESDYRPADIRRQRRGVAANVRKGKGKGGVQSRLAATKSIKTKSRLTAKAKPASKRAVAVRKPYRKS